MRTNRREFLERSIEGTVGATLAMSELVSPAKATPANDRVVVGIIGTGFRGCEAGPWWAERSDVEVAYVCDAHPGRLAKGVHAIEKVTGKRPKAVIDFRTILDDKQVDAVYAPLPHQWHALITVLACQAGKDIYVEHPGGHTIWEGQKMLEAARKYNRVVQVGTQMRSSSYAKSARELIQSGKLGDIHLVRIFNMFYRHRFIRLPDSPTPKGMNWDLWLGPAPMRPYSDTWFLGWLNFWDFSGGIIDDDADHQVDLFRMVTGMGYPKSVYHAGGNLAFHDDVQVPDTSIVIYEYPEMKVTLEETWWAPYMKKTPESIRESRTQYAHFFPFNGERIEIYGTNAMMLLGRHGGGWQLFDAHGEKIAEQKEPHIEFQKAHIANFIECIHTRQRPNADIAVNVPSTRMCEMANVSYRVGDRRLEFDPNTGTFNDQEANQYLKPSYRKPWVVPEKV
jgi:predicted dehydrogenase